ncbi:MAG: hypothetical protein KJ052_07905 [Candidatus Hydrogenedentes bacterium]|nr:hypothetical protein [Candidatus Hydrogenedentota bacterium]
MHATRDKFMLAGWTGLATDRDWTSYTPSTNMRADVDSFEPSFVQSLGPFFTGYLTHTARATKGGVAFIGEEDRAGHYGDGLQLSSFRTYAFHPSLPFYWGYAKLAAKADLGYEFSHWTDDGNGPPVGNPPKLAYSRDTGARSAKAEFLRMLDLVTKVDVLDGSATPAQAGYVVASDARKYYSALDTTYVQLNAAAHPGYCFSHWSGKGVAYLDDDDEPDLQYPLPLDDPNIVVASSMIWIEMYNNLDGGGGGCEAEAHMDQSKGIKIYYHKPQKWNVDGYYGDRFQQELVNEAFAGMDWSGVKVGEQITFLCSDFDLSGTEVASLTSFTPDIFEVKKNFAVPVCQGGQIVDKTGTWIVGANDGPTSDHHYIDARVYDTIKNYYVGHSDEMEIRLRQSYVITDWGSNNPADYPSTCLGSTNLRFKFCKLEGPCYTTYAICHVRVEKGGVHHPCAWGLSPLGGYNENDINHNFDCTENCGPP